MQTIKIRYNTLVGDTGLYWRVIIDGEEHLASDIDIQVPTHTTMDEIPEVGAKHHITCTPDIIEWDGKKVILRNKETEVSRIRHVLKAFTWRMLGTIDTIILSWIISGNFKVGVSIGGVELITKMFLYYAHERVWYRIRFGVKKD